MNTQTIQNPAAMPPENNLKTASLITIVAILGILGIYYQTASSMVATWNRSETYAHGFLILPFCIYMIWTRRLQLMRLDHQTNLFALLVLIGMGFVWLVAALASVQIVTQYMLVAMIPMVVWALLGKRILIATAFPLTYLLFAVPFGDVLIPPLIDFTADFTVSALQLTGIPVFREGTFFSLPTGNWSVVEACSGLRYLIASLTLGTLYAYLTYQSYQRRIIFIILSIIVPIIANGIRAYLIVMTGHLSGMTIAVGVDHLLYGWLFFGLVMLLLFWIGSFWREDDDNEISQPEQKAMTKESSSLKKTSLMACAVLIIAIVWPVSSSYLDNKTVLGSSPEIIINDLPGNWIVNADQLTNWEPIYVGTPTKLYQHYQHADQTVNLYITYYHNQQQGDELINFGNVLVTEDDIQWRIVSESTRTININSQQFNVRQTQLHSRSSNLLVWRWYWLGDEETISPYFAKALLARNRLFSSNDGGAEIIIASQYKDVPEEAVPNLIKFLDDTKAAIAEKLYHAQGAL